MRLRLLLLTSTPTGAAGVDLDSGALLRTQWTEPAPVFSTYELIEAEGLGGDDLPFPRDMVAAARPTSVGRMRGRKAERLLRPLGHPTTQPLLGTATSTLTYWTLPADAPSVALVSPGAGPVVERSRASDMRCRFRWRRLDHDLPLDDPRLEERLSHPTATRLAGATLARALGWKPERLLVALRPPVDGRCEKVVSGLLPRP